MSTAIIGVGNIGKAVATHLAAGGETVVLAAGTPAQAGQLARDLGPSASAAGVADAIDRADAVIFAVWLNVLEEGSTCWKSSSGRTRPAWPARW